jgi:hypothetical protein
MDVDNTDLSAEELDLLIQKLSREGDELEASEIGLASLTQSEDQTDLKTRLQRGIDELIANGEDVPPHLIRLLGRL